MYSKTMIQVQGHISSWCLLAALIAVFGFASAPAVAQSNQTSPLGVGLNGVTYYTSEQPFLNIFKTAQMPWDTGGGANGPVALDANGYPTSMIPPGGGAPYGALGSLMLRALTSYPAGNYVLLYDGEGTVLLGFDASLVSSSPGRQVYTVATPSNNGIVLRITATDPNKTGNYIRNIRVVYSPDSTASTIGARESLLNGGEIFNPDFINRIAPFRVLRFMDWMGTNNSTDGANWSARTLPSNVSWGMQESGATRSVPVEVIVALGNKIGADIWVNMPHLATDDYVGQFATYVLNNLGSKQNVYLEYSNETWNFVFSQASYMVSQGKATWLSTRVSDFDYNRSYFGMRTAQICDSWKSVWGSNANRVICVMAAQAANTYTATQSLACPLWSGAPCSGHGINAIAIAPYFGYDVPNTWTTQPDGGLTSLFTEIMQGGLAPGGYAGGMIKQALDWVTSYRTVTNSYGLPLIAYEGGQHLVNSNDTALATLYISANRDSRMGTAYATYLQGWRNAGGQLFCHFVDASTYTKWGSWGALERLRQNNSPKYGALTSFIAANPCWWPNCNTQTTGSNTQTTGDIPTVIINSPASGTKLNGNGTLMIDTTANDRSGIASITIQADGKTLNICPNATSCSAQWQGKNITKGAHSISATAINNAGMTGSASVTILSIK
jgi:hypothetical protein